MEYPSSESKSSQPSQRRGFLEVIETLGNLHPLTRAKKVEQTAPETTQTSHVGAVEFTAEAIILGDAAEANFTFDIL